MLDFSKIWYLFLYAISFPFWLLQIRIYIYILLNVLHVQYIKCKGCLVFFLIFVVFDQKLIKNEILQNF